MGIQSVAIIGGGVSGLSVAYTLLERGFGGAITVVERKPTLGGNAATAEVVLGRDYRKGAGGKEFVRVADLGVNDVNLTSYPTLKAAMEKIGYLGDKEWDHLRPLEDTVSFFTPDGKEIWTKDKYLTGDGTAVTNHNSVVDVRFSLDERDPQLARDEAKFMDMAAEDYDPKLEADKPEWWDLTVVGYVAYFRANRLAASGISDENLTRLVRLFLMPRVAAMYFTPDDGPDEMPMRGVMSYYRLQEGYGAAAGTEPDRRYFVHGSHHWIEWLASWLETQGVKIVMDFEAEVTGNGAGGVTVTNASGAGAFEADVAVMAAHADHQLNAFVPCEDALLTTQMARNLGSVQHALSRAYAHTWPELLPQNMGSWRTYNVMIREDITARRYQMTYVQNRHRNDHMNPEFNEYGLPVYFVSLNPQWAIPDEFILRNTEAEKARRLVTQQGYGRKLTKDDADIEKAVTTFRHTVMTDRLLKIQKDLPNEQGMAGGRVFFAGCWTKGAGLHEECFEQAAAVVEAMEV